MRSELDILDKDEIYENENENKPFHEFRGPT